MKLQRIGLAFAISAAALTFAATPAVAAGGGGASFCSNSGAPTGGAPQTYGNAGEIISWIAQNEGNGGSANDHPGPVVADACNPSPSGP
jgi:hypothetical protein